MYTIANPTKDELGKLKKDDRVRVNDWELALTVIGKSENYILLADTGTKEYSVISMIPATFNCNQIKEGTTYCGPDNWLFGYFSKDSDDGVPRYNYDNPLWVSEYLNSFENGDSEISQRHGCTIRQIVIQ
jgi:hypothetical protein